MLYHYGHLRGTTDTASLDVGPLTDYDCYLKSMRSRQRQSIKQVAKAFRKYNVHHERATLKNFSKAHLLVILDHQWRAIVGDEKPTFEHIVKVILWTQARLALLAMMPACAMVDEYYVPIVKAGRKLASFCVSFCLGEVLFVEYFYVRAEFQRAMTWYHASQMAVKRGIEDGRIKYVDIGPSFTDEIAKRKAKIGFTLLHDWQSLYDTQGVVYEAARIQEPTEDVPPEHHKPFNKRKGTVKRSKKNGELIFLGAKNAKFTRWKKTIRQIRKHGDMRKLFGV